MYRKKKLKLRKFFKKEVLYKSCFYNYEIPTSQELEKEKSYRILQKENWTKRKLNKFSNIVIH